MVGVGRQPPRPERDPLEHGPLAPAVPPVLERDDQRPPRGNAKGSVRGGLARRGVAYVRLAEWLAAIGVEENERNPRRKKSRGKLTVGFLLQVTAASGGKGAAWIDAA